MIGKNPNCILRNILLAEKQCQDINGNLHKNDYSFFFKLTVQAG
jgi:hypothetical protein